MKCDDCDGTVLVVGSRHPSTIENVFMSRTRACQKCGKRFITYEIEREAYLRGRRRTPEFRFVVDKIESERAYQDKNHGTLIENPHEIGQWLAIIQDELNGAAAAYVKCHTGMALHELVQVATAAVACLEQHGIGKLASREQLKGVPE